MYWLPGPRFLEDIPAAAEKKKTPRCEFSNIFFLLYWYCDCCLFFFAAFYLCCLFVFFSVALLPYFITSKLCIIKTLSHYNCCLHFTSNKRLSLWNLLPAFSAFIPPIPSASPSIPPATFAKRVSSLPVHSPFCGNKFY